MLAIDFAWTHPDPANVKGHGYTGVIGYLSHDRTGKCLSDWRRYADAGLGVALVFEDSAGRATQGWGAGQADAVFANSLADQWGFPGTLLYYACDTDVGGATGGVVDYCRGAQSVGRRGVGIYGSFYVVRDVLNAGAASLGWQTVAWSRGNVEPRACLYQYARAVPIPGTDENEVRTSYWGQHSGVPSKPAPKEEAMEKGMIVAHSSGSWWFCRGASRTYIGDMQTANILAFLQQSVNNKDAVPFVSDDVLNQFRDLSSRHEAP